VLLAFPLVAFVPPVAGVPAVDGFLTDAIALAVASVPVDTGGILRTVLYNETCPRLSDYKYRSRDHSQYIDIRVWVP
jgi:hypothetical protein